ncbi:three-Cys-motif partner protein TcmP [Chitinibacter sp. S2-10]|uniref:three-Cys-motif partner protein TcmP n=1 Tax=Chitinibacter sp. S2-10 TaxID=3373597 RepID=UPI0039773876
MKHHFGGPWTFIKVDMLGRYLNFFNTALQHQPSKDRPFRRIYIDAFAGTGQCDIKVGHQGRMTIEGSALRAIQSAPHFDKIHLVELKNSHVESLKQLASQYPEQQLTIHNGDCNIILDKILESTNWKSTRGVLFLDPYGMSVHWETVQKIAATQALDVWYLFPLSAIYRQAANDYADVDDGKAAALDQVLGTTAWRDDFYSERSATDFFAQNDTKTRERHATPNDIATWVHQRLAQTFAGWVSPPIMLPTEGAPLFALFFAVSNPSSKAVQLSRKAAAHLFEMLRQKRITPKSMPVSEDTQHDLFG